MYILYKIKFFIVFVSLFIFGCAYNHKPVDQKIADLQSNKLEEKFLNKINYLKDLDANEKSKNYLLLLQEAGRVAFIINDTNTSVNKFNNAIAFYAQQEDIAKINLKSVKNKVLASTIADDNSLQYLGSDYERALVHFYQALNYLKLNDLEKSMVEIRATNDSQKLAIANRENKIDKTEANISKYQFSSDINLYLKESQQIRGSLKEKFLNPYIYYISGNIRELNGDVNGALVDYKNAYEINYNNDSILQDLLRLSQKNDNTFYNTIIKNNPNIDFKDQNEYKNSKTLLIVYEDQFIQKKIAKTGSVYLFEFNRYVKISLPVYENSSKSSSPYINFNNNNIVLDDLTNIGLLANNELSENYSAILLRQITRLTTKLTMQNSYQRVNDKSQGAQIAGTAVAIAGAISSAVEKADTRSFETLPQYVKVAKINTNEDMSNIEVYSNGRKIKVDNLNLKNGEIAILYIIDSGNYIYHNIIYKGLK